MIEPKGAFITVEGPDGAGKSTQITFIKAWLQKQNRALIVTREPGGTMLGEALRELLLNGQSFTITNDAELLMVFAARYQHIQSLILPAIQCGTWVLSDRFTDATYAYQGGGRGIDFARIAVIEQWVQAAFQPDLTLLLDVPVEVGLRRTKRRNQRQDRFEAEEVEFKQRVRDAYLIRAKNQPDRIQLIDASVDIAKVQNQLDRVLHLFLEQFDV